ncbi:MAG: GNAT family N-acetyltransferase [Acidimicrobiia bacterium]|nr:GNAT family N-acetyltransferase [Acidimicrobiia bacterium]
MSLTVRHVTDADIPGVVALVADRIGEEDAPEAQLVLEDAEYDRRRWTVAVDGDRVVSTMGTYPMCARLGDLELPAALVEFVATATDYEGRGLVRRQFDYHHTDLLQRDELLEVMVGITYFYRRLGYEYALPVAPWQEIPSGDVPDVPEGWTVRVAGETDRQTIRDLQRPIQNSTDLSIGLSDQMWSFLLRSPVYDTLLAEHRGVPQACGRIYLHEDDPYVMDLAGGSRDGLLAILAGVGSRNPGRNLTVLTRPEASPNLDDLGSLSETGEAYYARIGDPLRWLNAIRPVLSSRLSASSLAGEKGEGMISLYASSIRFPYANGEVGEFTRGPREQAPISKGGSGVPPDLMTSLLAGPLGFVGLAERHPDMNGGSQQELMSVLFPPLTLDVQTWVVP